MEIEIAGVGRRMFAIVYDAFLVIAIWFAVAGMAVSLNGGESLDGPAGQLLLLPLLFSTYFFYCWFWLHGGQTLGMRAWRLKLVPVVKGSSNKTESLNLRDCTIRFFAALLFNVFGYVWVFFNKQRLTGQDIISGTCIVLVPKDETSQ